MKARGQQVFPMISIPRIMVIGSFFKLLTVGADIHFRQWHYGSSVSYFLVLLLGWPSLRWVALFRKKFIFCQWPYASSKEEWDGSWFWAFVYLVKIVVFFEVGLVNIQWSRIIWNKHVNTTADGQTDRNRQMHTFTQTHTHMHAYTQTRCLMYSQYMH